MLYVLKARKAKPLKSETSENEGTDQDARDEICGDRGKLQQLCKSGQEKSRKQTNRK